MIFGNVTPQNSVNTQVFTARNNGASPTQSWTKPFGVSMVYIWAVGAGADGGAGLAGTTNGSGGGASGQFKSVLLPARFIPSTLAITLPPPNSGQSVVIADPASNTSLFVVGSGSVPTAGSTTGGAANTGASTVWHFLGILQSTPGIAGAAGGASGVAGTDVAAITQFNSPGAGGGGTNAAGTSATSGGNVPAILTYPARSGGVVSSPGNSGHSFTSPFLLTTGGAGGGGGNLNAGNGGNAGFGCGGGGAGGVATGGTVGAGGLGGSPLVVIMSW